jgi:2-keto-4-pentenoate hydratase/2-oxohepta-3-ene-1,7-dioic acid hydratase in catechol pathway
VIPNPGKIWCVGLNYGDHVQETGRQVTEHPVFFLRVADSQAGHGVAIPRPSESIKLDYEGEIAVVIGKAGRRISEGDAWDHIAGYACYNDGSVRDSRCTPAVVSGKNFWRTGRSDPDGHHGRFRRHGDDPGDAPQRHRSAARDHRDDDPQHPRQIAYASTVAPLRRGDCIVTGTLGGIGAKRTPPLWMKAGDVVEVEVDRIGVLRNPIVDEA